MRTDELDFHLPSELIAQTPADKRSASRLLHYDRGTGATSHRHFVDLPSLLRTGDLLVFNNARVLPARFSLVKETGVTSKASSSAKAISASGLSCSRTSDRRTRRSS